MTINVTVLPDSAVAAPAPRAPQLPAISAAGINDAATISRQQLMSAVPAPALIPAYNANGLTAAKPPVVSKPTISYPSSPLAAQMIAQSPSISEEELAIFEPRPPQTKAADEPADDYLDALRIARGDLAAADKANKPAAKIAAQQTSAITENKTAQTAALTTNAEPSMRASLAQLAVSLPALLTQIIRPPSFTRASGISAYQLAQTRNNTIRKPADLPEPAAT